MVQPGTYLEDETYKFASHNALGGLLVFTRFFDKEKGAIMWLLRP
jgi:hypothetical protein